MPIDQKDSPVPSAEAVQYDQLIQKIIKLETSNEMLTKSLDMVNQRMGVEIIADSDSDSESLDDSDLFLDVPNTREFQRDSEFAQKYYYITDVMS